MSDYWPHQDQADHDIMDALNVGERKICVTSPTGGGKTRMMFRLAARFVEDGMKVVLYTNRRILLEQTSQVMLALGMEHGVRAAGCEDERHYLFQVSSIQTEHARVRKGGSWHLHEADLVLVDEAHSQKGPAVTKILNAHIEQGASYVGFTATPVDLANMYSCLVVAGTPSELRKCRALVPAVHYGPDEPDLRRIGRFPLGDDLTEKQQRKVMMVPGLYGRVIDWYRRLNPENRPTILFAPGVGESIKFAQEFHAAGITAAHIDGQEVWINGFWQGTNPQARKEVLNGSRSGKIAVLCNRFVLREGVDAPWLAHGVLATAFGSLQSYLQAGGRLLRAYPGVERVTIQDHGGNWWRHGSLNADRLWRLDMTSRQISALREERLRAGGEKEPKCCPLCKTILAGPRCPCGWEHQPGTRPVRTVLQNDGTEKLLEGAIYQPRRTLKHKGGPELWKRMYHRARNPSWDATFREAEALFAFENHWNWPDRSWPLMPRRPEDWIRKVAAVPREELT